MLPMECKLFGTFWSRQNDGFCLCFRGQLPGPLMQPLLISVFGVWKMDIKRSRMRHRGALHAARRDSPHAARRDVLQDAGDPPRRCRHFCPEGSRFLFWEDLMVEGTPRYALELKVHFMEFEMTYVRRSPKRSSSLGSTSLGSTSSMLSRT